MALFRKNKIEKKEEEKKEAPEVKKAEKGAAAPAAAPHADYSHVLRRPRITEKATFASERGAYVFEVDMRATKYDVAKAVEQVYKVKPRKVNIVQIPAKKIQSRFRGLYGVTSRGKKAYVYLKEGQTIEIV